MIVHSSSLSFSSEDSVPDDDSDLKPDNIDRNLDNKEFRKSPTEYNFSNVIDGNFFEILSTLLPPISHLLHISTYFYCNPLQNFG